MTLQNLKTRSFFEEFSRSFDYEYVSVLVGQRQVGKTTFIKNFIEQKQIPPEDCLYINLDNLYDREKIESSKLQNLIEDHFRAQIKNFTKQKVIIIDEAQKSPAIFEEIKIIFDEFKVGKKIKFILSGSSTLDLYKQSAESLAGRVNFKRAFSFTLNEVVQINNLKSFNLPMWRVFEADITFEDLREFFNFYIPGEDQAITKLLEKVICYGSLPDVVKAYDDKIKVTEYLQNYKTTYIDRDIRSLNRVGELDAFSKLYDLLAMQSGGILVKSNLCSDSGISLVTLDSYLSILQNTFIIDLIQPSLYSRKKRLIKSPKTYIFDNGLMQMAHGFPTWNQIEAMDKDGEYFENFVYNELKKNLYNKTPFMEINFFRTQDDAEIDFILDYKHKRIPIEVKLAKNIDARKLTILKHFIKDNDCPYGVVIYRGEFAIDKENKIIFFPVQFLASSFN